MSYEELCRAHTESFIRAAAAAEVQSELAARVASWRAKVCSLHLFRKNVAYSVSSVCFQTHYVSAGLPSSGGAGCTS